MEPGATSTLRVTGSPQDAIAAIKEALPDDAIVRDEDDGVGRFAGDRVVMLIGIDGNRLMMARGSWRRMKDLEDKPELDITIEETKDGCKVRMKAAEAPKATVQSHAWSVVSNGATVAMVVVAYHMFQDLEIDVALVAGMSAGGGVLFTAVSHFWPKKKDEGLAKTVRAALRPMLKKKKKKKPEPAED